MSKKDIIVIGASAGGMQPLFSLIKSLPAGFPASVFVVMHISPFAKSYLPELIAVGGNLDAVHPHDGQAFKKGIVYVAPPDHHMLVESGRILVKKGPRENRFRPAIDALFRSAAYHYGPRVIGVILSGLLNDGTSGLWTINRMGGTTIIQDPAEAVNDSMPRSVLEYVNVDHMLPTKEIAATLMKLCNQTTAKKPRVSSGVRKLIEAEIHISKKDNAFDIGIMDMGNYTPFTCPECHGALVQLKHAGVIRFRCHTGHAFTTSALMSGISEITDHTLWQAMQLIESNIMLLNKIGDYFKSSKRAEMANSFYSRARFLRTKTRGIHELVLEQTPLSEDTVLPKKLKKTAGNKNRKTATRNGRKAST